MDPVEITETQTVGREEAAARLHALADALAGDDKVGYERGGLKLKLHVPDEVDYKLEIELDDDECGSRWSSPGGPRRALLRQGYDVARRPTARGGTQLRTAAGL